MFLELKRNGILRLVAQSSPPFSPNITLLQNPVPFLPFPGDRALPRWRGH